jgi:hypothetical protein
MLITIYEENNSAKFSANFDTPITLPKNTELSLLKAYIPRDNQITISNANNHLTIYMHSKDPNAKQVITIPNGNYGVEEFAKTLQTLLKSATNLVNTTQVGQLSFLEAVITPTLDDEGLSNESINIYLRCATLSPSFYYEMNYQSVGNQLVGNITSNKQTANDTLTLSLTDQNMRASVYQTNGGVDKSGWDSLVLLDKVIERKWFGARNHSNYANSLPPFNDTHALISFKIGDTLGSTGSFMVGVKQHGSAVDLSGITTGDLSQINQIAGVSLAVVCYGDTANGKTAGSVEVFEDVAGTFTSLGNFVGNNIALGDEIIILIPNNGGGGGNVGCKYFCKFLNGTIRLLNITNTHRYIPLPAQVFNPCFSFFKGTGAVDMITDLKMGMDAGYVLPAGDTTKGVGIFDEYGKYIKVALGGATNDNKTLGATLGYTHDEYEKDGTASNTRTQPININNEGAMKTNDDNQPFVNLNITNLPITSYSCNSSDGLITTHDYSKCVASIPRYNQDDGHFSNNAIIFDDNTQSIKLNNKSEIVLSSLDCRLQNCDGEYPKDLLTPSSFVFKISGDDLN